MRCLVVDEELDIERLVESLRRRYPDDSFDLARDISQAIELLYERRYDVLLFDLWFPGNDNLVPRSADENGLLAGLRLEEKISGDDKCCNRNTPVVFLSGLHVGESVEVKDLRERYGTFYLTKPVSVTSLYRLLVDAASGEKV